MEHFAIEYRDSKHAKVEAVYFPDIDDHIVNVIRRSGTFYESDLLEHLRLSVPRQGVFIDVGANIGNHTVFFAKYMASRVVAIEPHPRNYEILNSVVLKNGLTNVETIETAVGSEKGTATLSLPDGYEGNAGTYTITQGSPAQASVEVTVDSLDAVLSQHIEDQQEITLIKIDVEGYEEQVLEGAKHILETKRPDIVVEIHSAEQHEAIAKQLALMGYRVLGQFCASPTYHFACWSPTQHAAWLLRKKARQVMSKVRRW